MKSPPAATKIKRKPDNRKVRNPDEVERGCQPVVHTVSGSDGSSALPSLFSLLWASEAHNNCYVNR